jgi:outer membrane lipoprotein-sorting protein
MNPSILDNAIRAGKSLTMRATHWDRGIGAVLRRTIRGDAPGPTQTTSPLRRRQKGNVAICLGLTLLSLGQVSRAEDEQRASEIVDRVARLFSSKSSIATVEMQITKEALQRKISMQFWSLGESKILVRILHPQEDAGTAILKVGNKTWLYLPNANRTVMMPASMMVTPWMGSHFTLNDLVSQSRLSNDYDIAVSFAGLRDGVAVSEYTLTPKPSAVVVWGKIALEVRQADQMPVWQRFYDEDGKLVRELSFSDYKTVSGRLIPTRLVMRPVDQPSEQTTITYENIVFDAPISEETFSLSNLKQ